MLRPIFAEIIPALETARVLNVERKLTAAHLPPADFKEIVADAHWPEPAKKALELSAPECVAEVMNSTGISSERRHWAVMLTGIGAIFAQDRRLCARLDKIIEAANPEGVKP